MTIECVCVFQGCVVEVKMQSGVVYEGILRAISPHMDIALKVAHDKSKVLVLYLYTVYFMLEGCG